MGAARDLTFAVFAEVALLGVIVLAALAAGTDTDLRAMSDAAATGAVWHEPAHWCAALAFVLVALAEGGRQPVDNADTHLELTMVHEGPLLEYAGRDLALLQWAGAARLWVLLVLGAELFGPSGGGFGLRLAILAATLVTLCLGARGGRDEPGQDARAARAAVPDRGREPVPGRSGQLGAGSDGMTTPALWALVVLGLTEVVVRRRSVGVALVATQSLVLGALALHDADGTSGLFVAGAILVVRGLILPLLLGRAITRTREPRRIASDRTALLRLVLSVAVVGAAAALVPAFGLTSRGAEQATIGLLVLGLLIAMLRGSVVFQAIGFLVAENGVYLATLSVGGALPAIIEIGLVADLLLAVAVAAAFGARIHERFGTSDTSLMRSLRD